MKQYPVSRDGWSYIAVLALLTIFIYWLRPGLAILPGILLLFVLYFFRNPKRSIPEEPFTLVSPADGVVKDVERVFEERFLMGESIRIRIFSSLFDVHVNRSPMEGKVVYHAQNFIGIENKHLHILVNQITGFVARRIVYWAKEGDTLQKGERFGLIKFGSCTEIFLQPDVEVLISAGDKVRGGETIVGRVISDE